MNKILSKRKKQKDNLRKYQKWHRADWTLIFSFLLLLFFGLISLASAGTAVAYEIFHDSYYFFKHQLFIGIIPGLFLMFIFSNIDYKKLKNYASVMLVLSIFLLISVFIPGLGAGYGTAKSWIILGGLSFQPSELVKLTFLIYLSAWLVNRGEKKVKNFNEGFLPFIFTLGIIILLMVLQPDVGTMSIIVFTALIVYFIAGASWKHIILLGIVGALSLALLINISPYRAQRFMTFLHPELDPQGVGYHINQAFLAIGSGGFTGRGYGHSRQKFQYLPEVTGDSIFAIIAEELGFIFSVALIFLFLFIAYRGIKIAKNSSDKFGQLLAIGIISWFIIQAFFNIASMLGLMPMTGVPLPFVSSGGSAMLVALASVGILINISKQTEIK